MALSYSLAPCTKELRKLGFRAMTFSFKRNPMDFDCKVKPKRTLGMCYRLGRTALGSRPWLFVEFDENVPGAYEAINAVAERYHVAFTTFAAPCTEGNQ